MFKPLLSLIKLSQTKHKIFLPKTKLNLKHHAVIHDSRTKEYGCNECGHLFRRKCELEIHSRKHTGEKPYACKDCPKSFSQRGALKTHTYLHTGIHPLKCAFCQWTGIQKINLSKHILKFHPQGNELTS